MPTKRNYKDKTLKLDERLVKSKTAVEFQNIIYVSPAMWALLEGLDSEDMMDLLDQIPIRLLTSTEFFVFQAKGKLPPGGGQCAV